MAAGLTETRLGPGGAAPARVPAGLTDVRSALGAGVLDRNGGGRDGNGVLERIALDGDDATARELTAGAAGVLAG